MFAHIYKAPKTHNENHWRLIISRSPAITADQVINETEHDTKQDAKIAAKLAGAKAWNY
jgi:hypothetical protein